MGCSHDILVIHVWMPMLWLLHHVVLSALPLIVATSFSLSIFFRVVGSNIALACKNAALRARSDGPCKMPHALSSPPPPHPQQTPTHLLPPSLALHLHVACTIGHIFLFQSLLLTWCRIAIVCFLVVAGHLEGTTEQHITVRPLYTQPSVNS